MLSTWPAFLPLEEVGDALPTPMWMPDPSGLGMTLPHPPV